MFHCTSPLQNPQTSQPQTSKPSKSTQKALCHLCTAWGWFFWCVMFFWQTGTQTLSFWSGKLYD